MYESAKHWVFMCFRIPCLIIAMFASFPNGYHFKDIPEIQKFSFQENILEGKIVSVTCLAITRSKSVDFKWFKNGKELLNAVRNVKIREDSEYSILILDPVSADDSGNYTCKASNAHGSSQHTAYLSVKAPPKWVETPNDIFATVRDSLIVTCSAQGSPLPRISWKKYSNNNRNENLTNHEQLQVEDRIVHLLKFSSLSYEDDASYQCIADNGIPPSLVSNFTLSVRVPAKFEEKFAVVNVKKGDSGRMKCEALGDQPLSITWQRDDATISKTGDERYEIFETMVPKGVVSELIIRTSEKEDGALYTCIAENEFGNDHRKIRLLVLEVPAPPLDVKIREIWSRSSSVSWAPPYSGNSPITKYIVQYWRDLGGAPHRLIEISVPSSQSSAIMKDLHPGAAYVLKLVAENAVGRGEPSDAATFRTGEEEPSSPPSDIIAEPRGSSTIRVSWKPPPKDSWNGELRSYYVGYKVRDSNQPYSYKTIEYAPEAPQQEFFLTNLLKASDYSVVVKASNTGGSGPPSHEMYVRTLDGDLPPAPSLYVLSTSSTSVSLRWNTRKIDNPLSGYTVHYREEDQGEWQEVAVIAPEDNTYILNNLHPQKLYQIYVTATNQYGKGDPSEIVAVKTDEGGHSLLSVAGGGVGGGYMDVAIIIPVAASLLTIGVVLFVACICVKKIRSRHNLERALAAEKHLAMVGTLQRYVDIDKTRSLMDPSRLGHYPLPYETIQMMAEGKGAFIGKDGTQTIYNKTISTLRAKEDQDHIYDSAQ
ncbi:cell adhesion molecule Dscam1 isoform X1 [Parasteatoda tepidariorum]|uniref:cell adhesion molecule Dscam1 isoform X1 n=1 Tax=Parasteatoda tepidariorum TaxID=114398 RepID=UPI0039BC620E